MGARFFVEDAHCHTYNSVNRVFLNKSSDSLYVPALLNKVRTV